MYFSLQAESLTESDSWMCPECQDKEARKDKSKGNKRVTTPASSYKRATTTTTEFKPIPITPMTITAATSKEEVGSKKAAKIVPASKKKEEEKKTLAPVPPKKNLVLAEKLKKAATATQRKSGDR